jgi:hypothetical protein
MLAAVVITECSGAEEGCAIPALPCKLAAVMMIKELWWVCCIQRCHASSLLL